jgi:hypothetical protein
MKAQPPTSTADLTSSPSPQIIIFALNEHHPVLTSNSSVFPVTQTRKTISNVLIYFKTKSVYDHYTKGGHVALGYGTVYRQVYYYYYYYYYLTAIGLTPGGSSTVHIYTQTVLRKGPHILVTSLPCTLSSLSLSLSLSLSHTHTHTHTHTQQLVSAPNSGSSR